MLSELLNLVGRFVTSYEKKTDAYCEMARRNLTELQPVQTAVETGPSSTALEPTEKPEVSPHEVQPEKPKAPKKPKAPAISEDVVKAKMREVAERFEDSLEGMTFVVDILASMPAKPRKLEGLNNRNYKKFMEALEEEYAKTNAPQGETEYVQVDESGEPIESAEAAGFPVNDSAQGGSDFNPMAGFGG